MRDVSEIQRAHDMLVAIILGEVPVPVLDPEVRECIATSVDVLCWVLRHSHSEVFAKNLAAIDEAMGALGFTLERKAH